MYYSRELIVVLIVAVGFLREEYQGDLSGLAMSGRGKRARSAAKDIIFNVYKYFERQASNSKYRGPSQVTCKMAETTGYPEQTRIVKASMCGAVFTSPAKQYKVDRRTVCLVMWKPYGTLSMIFYHEKYSACTQKFP